MLYRERTPRPELRPFINCFWMIRSSQPGTIRDRTFPDGCQEIVFNLETTVLRDDGAGFSANPSTELVGQMTRPYDIVTHGGNCFFGVKFYPHSFSAFTRQPIHDLKDQSVDLQYLFQPRFARIMDTVFAHPDFDRFVGTMEQWFMQRLAAGDAGRRGYLLVDHAVRALLTQKEPARLGTLPEQLGVSSRYLQLLFRQHVGLRPRQLLKMLRFQKTFQYLHDARISLSDVAQRCGYYDHAHFVHDFRSLAGVSPSQYMKMDTPLNGFFLSAASRAYLCNYRS